MIYNYTDISLTEFPGEISLVLYSGSCLCHCPWCFNSHLLNKKPLSFKQMKDAINEHEEFITAVVFSGGEPLLNPFLKKIINYCKSKNLKIKINTNGLVSDNIRQNMFLPHVDYINISLKGLWTEYKHVLNKQKVFSIIPLCNTLEYSFVYSPTIWPQVYLNFFKLFLEDKITSDWRNMFSDRWSQPDIFTISQMQTGDCLNSQYNDCSVPTVAQCQEVAKLFRKIPKRKLIIETKEYGRQLYKETKNF